MYLESVEIRAAQKADLTAMVALHMQVFGDYFLTHLGNEMVRRSYLTYIQGGGNSVVCYYDNKLIGFIVGNAPGEDCGKLFYRDNFWFVVWAMLKALLLLDRVVWMGVWDRIRRIKKAIRDRFSKSKDTQDRVAPKRHAVAWLISIAVDDNFRGYGIAPMMIEFFEKQTRLLGGDEVMLCAYRTNARALSFYEKMGYCRFSETKLLYMYQKKLPECNVT